MGVPLATFVNKYSISHQFHKILPEIVKIFKYWQKISMENLKLLYLRGVGAPDPRETSKTWFYKRLQCSGKSYWV